MNSYTSDSYFHIGAQHMRSGLPCEDYALHGKAGNVQYLVVSDGCSSGGRTDVGARLLAHTTARAIERGAEDTAPTVDPWSIQLSSNLLLDGVEHSLALRPSDMFATLLVGVVQANGDGYARIYGDGVVAATYTNGVRVYSQVSWDDNMPFYPRYQRELRDAFVAAHGGDLTAERATHEVVRIAGDDLERTTRRLTLEQAMRGVEMDFPAPVCGPNPLHTVALFSDGIAQIEGVPWEQAVDEALAFRSTNGVVNTMQDKHIVTDMQLARWGDRVVYLKDGAVWSLAMK